MTPKLESTQLFKLLRKRDSKLADRVVMIRDELTKWLPQILRSFPHYPSHGVDHSDRIIAQLSNLLFNGSKPVLPFSGGEVYCLMCAAYLHDMGMVVSPGEAGPLLASDKWKAFIAENGKGYTAFRDYQALRDGPIEGTKERTDFLADVALRQLLAEFVRQDHHERGKTTLEMHPFLKQLVDDGDSVAFETIADLGVGHGLWDTDLTDESRFPEERDVLGDKVNVRFLARLLRIGDLLDMDSRRADPMTAKAVAPLPPDAIPHWKQYSTRKHENISPKAIVFTFVCEDQETHRILRDWFGWLESEVREAGLEQMQAARHDEWKAPRCIVSSRATSDEGDKKTKPTIIIRPAKGAKYNFHDWKLELDHERILERLIYDVYEDPSVFVRELIQNALDATRCQMYADFEAQNPGKDLPERPTQFPSEFRERYPIVLSLTKEAVKTSPDAAPEERTVFTIEDQGTGMNEHIITRYFLQIGRSYYQSSEFKERYKFSPTSRFGVGFLSVFAVSKDITVETACLCQAKRTLSGLRLVLREPRNYLLTEPWTPFTDRKVGNKTGTRIRVVMDGWGIANTLAGLVTMWCVAVEVPIVLREDEKETLIRRKRLEDKAVLGISKVNPNGRFILRSFDLGQHGVEGQIGLVAYTDEKGEGWCDCWPTEIGLDGKREDDLPKCYKGFVALHGIRVGRSWFSRRIGTDSPQWIQWADVRSAVQGITLSRSESIRGGEGIWRRSLSKVEDEGSLNPVSQAVDEATQFAVERHLAESNRAKGKTGALYRGRVLSLAPVSDTWRDHYPETVVTWRNGRREDISVAELLNLEKLVLAMWGNPRQEPPLKRHPKEVNSSVPIVSWSDAPSFSDGRFKEKLWGMNLFSIEEHGHLWLFSFSSARTGLGIERAHPDSPSWVAPLSLRGSYALRLEPLDPPGSHFYVMDRESSLVRWLSDLRAAACSNQPMIDSGIVEACWLSAASKWWNMYDLIGTWANNACVPVHLQPPRDDRGNLIRPTPRELRALSTL